MDLELRPIESIPQFSSGPEPDIFQTESFTARALPLLLEKKRIFTEARRKADSFRKLSAQTASDQRCTQI